MSADTHGIPTQPTDRDRYTEASHDLASHIGDKILTVLKHPDNQVRIQSILDPIVSHIIQRVFPYILLSAILFLILFILSVGTFWIVMRSGSVPVAAAATAAAISVGIK
jgi:hypothetical protein